MRLSPSAWRRAAALAADSRSPPPAAMWAPDRGRARALHSVSYFADGGQTTRLLISRRPSRALEPSLPPWLAPDWGYDPGCSDAGATEDKADKPCSLHPALRPGPRSATNLPRRGYRRSAFLRE